MTVGRMLRILMIALLVDAGIVAFVVTAITGDPGWLIVGGGCFFGGVLLLVFPGDAKKPPVETRGVTQS